VATADLSGVERSVEEAIKGSKVGEDVIEGVAGERHLNDESEVCLVS